MTLSTPSLSLAAHEGVHSLVQKGLIPKKEYRSLVRAGRRLVQKSPGKFLLKNPDQTHKNKKEAHEEYAAIFVENYYQNEKTARKYLMGEKVPIFEKFLGYIKEVKDIVTAITGNNEAIARSFLRRVERNMLINDRTKSATQGKKVTPKGPAHR